MIRPFQQRDVEPMLEVWYSASLIAHPFLDDAFLKKERKAIREVYIPATRTWIYEDEEGLAGFISLMGAEVGAIFVHPDKHGKGIGTALMDEVRKTHPVLEVEVFEKNGIGRAFYARYGFQQVAESIHADTGEPILRLRFDPSI